MTIPSHLAISHLEHAIVKTERELYVAVETGRQLTMEELQLRLDMMNRVWIYYHHNEGGFHNHSQSATGENVNRVLAKKPIMSPNGVNPFSDSYVLNETDGRERA